MLDDDATGAGVLVKGFSGQSGAKAAGMAAGDRVIRVGDRSIATYADIRIALLDSQPGQTLPVEILRKGATGDDERLSLQVALH